MSASIAHVVKTVVARYGGDATRLMDVLIDVQDELGCLTHVTTARIAATLGIPARPLREKLQALELYGVGMEEFMQSLGERRVDDGLARLLDEPLLRSLTLSEDDLVLEAPVRVTVADSHLWVEDANGRHRVEPRYV